MYRFRLGPFLVVAKRGTPYALQLEQRRLSGTKDRCASWCDGVTRRRAPVCAPQAGVYQTGNEWPLRLDLGASRRFCEEKGESESDPILTRAASRDEPRTSGVGMNA